MTHEEMKQEKVAMQKALIYFEGLHGRPVGFLYCYHYSSCFLLPWLYLLHV